MPAVGRASQIFSLTSAISSEIAVNCACRATSARKRRLGHGHPLSGCQTHNQAPTITSQNAGPLQTCRTPAASRPPAFLLQASWIAEALFPVASSAANTA